MYVHECLPVCMYEYVCVCERERETETERQRDRERERWEGERKIACEFRCAYESPGSALEEYAG